MKLERHKRHLGVGVIAILVVMVAGASDLAEKAMEDARWILSQCASYSENLNYSRAIPRMLLGYDKTGNVTHGVAMRSFKTYEDVTALIALKRDGDAVVVDAVDIPDVGVITDVEKQEKVLSALQGLPGKVIRDDKGSRHTIDAVTGATRYQRRVYVYMDKMAETILHEMDNNPDWPHKPAPSGKTNK
jgi:hypothetical protein